ncbi:MAG TPA: hypothetical protein VMN37_05870 [Gemmatimonadales bacterium]|nr:hypothetical protein [Gemmatimonadales bacterium]
MSKSTSVIAGIVLASLAAGCGGSRAVEIDPKQQFTGSRWNASLATPSELVGATQVRGTGWMGADERNPDRTRASVSISNAVPGGRHPWHVHVGQCGTDHGIFGSAGAYPVLAVKNNGQAEASATVEMALPVTGQYFISVHASPDNLGTVIACGNLAPPIR